MWWEHLAWGARGMWWGHLAWGTSGVPLWRRSIKHWPMPVRRRLVPVVQWRTCREEMIQHGTLSTEYGGTWGRGEVLRVGSSSSQHRPTLTLVGGLQIVPFIIIGAPMWWSPKGTHRWTSRGTHMWTSWGEVVVRVTAKVFGGWFLLGVVPITLQGPLR